MDMTDVLNKVPEKPSDELIKWTKNYCAEDLGGEYLFFSCERVVRSAEMQDLMDNRTWGRKAWAARCRCSACDEEFVTEKVPNVDAITVAYGDDGEVYPLHPSGHGWGRSDVIELADGDSIDCPWCGHNVRIMPAKRVKGGRTKQVQVAQLLSIDGYAAIVYWMISRRIDELGCWMDGYLRDVFILDEKGCVSRYSKRQTDAYGNDKKHKGWRRMGSSDDTWDKQYHDWGSFCDRKRGSVLYPIIPTLVGTTGEKTGLYEYCAQRSIMPIDYLKLWKKYTNVENLVKAGLAHLVNEAVAETSAYGKSAKADTIKEALWPNVDLGKAKPHEMLGLSKREYRNLHASRITMDSLNEWHSYRTVGGTEPADEIINLYFVLRERMHDLTNLMMQTGEQSYARIRKYLKKQGLEDWEGRILIDARKMARQLAGDRDLTEEELWPRRLQDAHDRLTEQLIDQKRKAADNDYQKGFDEVRKRLGCLEWNDGDLCVKLPKSWQELREEGNTLRHCVGGYGPEHARGESLIFFVRHYRRPERSYYTLNISMKPQPHEVQLHGYGNERHGPKKEHIHKIPKKVRDFCDRWKREVLMPYWKNQQNEERTEKTA